MAAEWFRSGIRPMRVGQPVRERPEPVPLILAVAVLILALVGNAPAPGTTLTAADPERDRFFESRVRPLLHARCVSCHGAAKQSAGLRLDIAPDPRVLRGARPEATLLIRSINHLGPRMPPSGKLAREEIGVLTEWVRAGAHWPAAARLGPPDIATARTRYWAFGPLRATAPPGVRIASWPRGDIDRFLLAKMEARGIAPAPDAERRVLLRRATYDLTGLPPTPEETAQFLADSSPAAFERVIDRLLASPAYGERWGRHWLDLVRYADTAGDNSDYPIPQAYRYRDWVIDAFNADMPYDHFVREQLAGDLLPGAGKGNYSALIATGYLAISRRFGSYEEERYPWHLTIEDTIDNVGRTFLALTINCCRCHDHKFDPLTQADYYALYGFFSSTRYPRPGIELDKVQRDFVPLASPEQVRVEAERRQHLRADLEARLGALTAERDAANRALTESGKLPEAVRGDRVRAANKTLQTANDRLKKVRGDLEAIDRQPLPYETAYAVAEGITAGKRKVGDACIQLQGDPERQGAEVPRRFPEVLGGHRLPPGTPGSGRLELARWIVSAENPLAARVIANRVWQYHFGRGIAATSSDFGTQGSPPSHPELLDYLARSLVQDGWSLKRLHRRIMLSRAYQMSGEEGSATERDPENVLFSRFPRRRLDAEEIRDTLLAVSGGLDRTRSGPHPFPAQASWGFTQHNPFKAVYDSDRRSVYLMTQRIQRHPFLALFDGPDTNASTAGRGVSITSLQGLYFLNDPFVRAQAKRFAERLIREESTETGRLNRAFQFLYARAPDAEEMRAAGAHLEIVRRSGAPGSADSQTAAWISLVRSLFLTSELVYLD